MPRGSSFLFFIGLKRWNRELWSIYLIVLCACIYIYKYIYFALIPHFFIFLAVQLPFNVLYTLPLYISFSDCVRPEREREISGLFVRHGFQAVTGRGVCVGSDSFCSCCCCWAKKDQSEFVLAYEFVRFLIWNCFFFDMFCGGFVKGVVLVWVTSVSLL
jgi:hypothetical protein